MKNIIVLFLLFSTSLTFAQEANIVIEIKNIKNNLGNIALALYDDPENFTKKEIRATKVSAKKGKVTAQFTNLPSGIYAIALFHDENNNDKMDFNGFGIPKEAYGFSNDAKGFMSAPIFKDASFELTKNESKMIKISL